MKRLDAYRGCMVGGAAGDALGYVVEFAQEEEIFFLYGREGITDYGLVKGEAQISDDTQMTLFTANGLLRAAALRMQGQNVPYYEPVAECYRDWFRTQREQYPIRKKTSAWLVHLPELFQRRAPGSTCMGAIGSGEIGTIENPINTSKGCGGIMRAAPVGLFFDPDNVPIEKIDRIGAETAAITHGQSLGYIPAAALVHIVSLLAHRENMPLIEAVQDMYRSIWKQFSGDSHLREFTTLVERAVDLAGQNMDDLRAIHLLGEGWVAEETLAIALYCALKYENDFDRALIAAVNHRGDSDSTGAVTGNILGAKLGLAGIPDKYLAHLELRNLLLDMADDLYQGCPENPEDQVFTQKYVEGTFSPKKH